MIQRTQQERTALIRLLLEGLAVKDETGTPLMRADVWQVRGTWTALGEWLVQEDRWLKHVCDGKSRADAEESLIAALQVSAGGGA